MSKQLKSGTWKHTNTGRAFFSSFPHERKSICPEISVISRSNSSSVIDRYPFSKKALCEITSFQKRKERRLQTSTHKGLWCRKKNPKTQQPLDGLAVVLRRSNFIVAGIEEWRGILYKVPEIKKKRKKKKKTFDHFLLLTHSCESWEVLLILTSGSLVDNWAAAPDSSRPGECTPAWLQFALKNQNHKDGRSMFGHLLIKGTFISLFWVQEEWHILPKSLSKCGAP